MAHEREVGLFRLDDGRRFKVVFVEAVNDRVQGGFVVVVGCEIDITGFFTVAIGVEGVGAAVFVVSKETEVLGPVSKRGGGVDKAVGAGDVVSLGKALKEEAVSGIVGMPEHLFL